MRELRNIITMIALTFVLAWMAGCSGCNPPPEPTGIDKTEGPETGGTPVRITGDTFDMKKGVTVTFGGKNAANVTVPSKTEITAVTPPGTAGQSVEIVVTNNRKPDAPVTLSQQFTYTDATPPTITGTDPSDGTTLSGPFEDSLNVRNSVSITFSEAVNSASGSVTVQVESTPDSLSQESGPVSGSVSGAGNTITFTSEKPMRVGRKYTVTVSGVTDTAGNALAASYSFGFTIPPPEKVKRYQVREGEKTLADVAMRPEVYDSGDREYVTRLIVANQDEYILAPNDLTPGQWLWVPRQKDEVWQAKK